MLKLKKSNRKKFKNPWQIFKFTSVIVHVMKKLNNIVDKIITRLGSSNDSEIVTAALAGCKLVCMPFATLSDKKSSKEQKTYALTRDFLTESIALTGYIGITGQIKNRLSAPICAKYYKNKAQELLKNGKIEKNSSEFKMLSNIDKTSLKSVAVDSMKQENLQTATKNQKEYIKKLEEVIKQFDGIQKPVNLYLNTKKTLSHLCVCTLALTFIPFITNKILEGVSKVKNKDEENKINPNLTSNQTLFKPMDINQYINKTQIGGLNVFSR